jgi:hypothetical protein
LKAQLQQVSTGVIAPCYNRQIPARQQPQANKALASQRTPQRRKIFKEGSMETKSLLSNCQRDSSRRLIATLCVVLLVPGNTGVVSARTQQSQQQGAASDQEAPKIPADQLDSLVAPIALYPDELLAQVLAASTYPLEIIQLQQWLSKNKNLKDKALVDAVSKQPWDASIQGMAALPDVVKRLADDIQWTTDLGNAFLAQQSDVMDAVQRMRKKAQGTGALKSNEQQKVETKVVENKTVVVVEQANPQVVYVPSYSPTVVYPPPVYPYPPIYYPPPPSTGAVIASAAISFGVGVAMGAMWSGGWGYGCGWGHNDVNINVNNNFNRNTNISNSGNRAVNTGNRTSNTWQHNSQHRGGAPYSNQATANKFGGTARGDSLSQRQASARQQASRQSGNPSGSSRAGSGAGGGAGVSNRAGGASAGNRPAGASASDRSAGGGSRASASTQATGGGDRVGSREVQSRSGGGDRGALGSSGGYSGSSARSSSSRGSSSMGASRGGGGGGRSGGGGGRRR